MQIRNLKFFLIIICCFEFAVRKMSASMQYGDLQAIMSETECRIFRDCFRNVWSQTKENKDDGDCFINLHRDFQTWTNLSNRSSINIYTFHHDNRTWDAARSECRKKNSDLATIKSAKEQQLMFCVAEKNKPLDKFFYFGLQKNDSNSFFQWIDDSFPTFNYWLHTEPNLFEFPACGAQALQKFGSEWLDVPCWRELEYICSAEYNAKLRIITAELSKTFNPSNNADNPAATDLVSRIGNVESSLANFSKIVQQSGVRRFEIDNAIVAIVGSETNKKSTRKDFVVGRYVVGYDFNSRNAITVALAEFQVNSSLSAQLAAASSSSAVQYVARSNYPYLTLSAYHRGTTQKLSGDSRYKINATVNQSDYEHALAQVEQQRSLFRQIYVRKISLQCVYVDEQKNVFSTFGCHRVEENSTGVTSCKCNHTTVFTVLLAVTTTVVPIEVKICSYVTESLSVMFLAITSAYLWRFKKQMTCSRSVIKRHLVVTLIFFHVINLFHDLALKNDFSCVAFAILLHYFLLSTAMWMLIDGINLSLAVSDNFARYRRNVSRLGKIYSLLGWGLPLIQVIWSAGVGITMDLYLKTTDYQTNSGSVAISKYNRCWIATGTWLYYVAVIGPLVFTIGVNLIIAITISVRLPGIRKRSIELRRNSSQESRDSNSVKSNLQSLFILLGTLGVSWGIGFLTGIPHEQFSEAMMYLHAVTNGLQGMLVFILYCILDENMRIKLLPEKKSSQEITLESNVKLST